VRCVVGARSARSNGMRLHLREPPARIALARVSIAFVVAVSAGPPEGGLYLKPPSSGDCATASRRRRRRGRSCGAVVGEDRVRDDGRGREPEPVLQHTSTPCAANTSTADSRAASRARACPCRRRAARSIPRRGPILDDRLGDREDVRLVERRRERRAAMSRRPERHALRGIARVGA
jgi:hypothetical protein